jgi:hypothetical protein
MELIKWLFDGFLFFVSNWTPMPISDKEIDPVFSRFFNEYLYRNKLAIAFGLFLIITLIIISSYLTQRSKLKKQLEGMLDHFIKVNSKALYTNTRITIFKNRNGVACCFSMIFMKIKHGKDLKKWPWPHLNRRYLWIYARIGQPNEDSSVTHFLMPKHENEIQGIVAQAAYSKGKICSRFTEIPSKEDIDDISELISSKSNKYLPEKIKKYMKESYINDPKILTYMNRIAKEIWACTLRRKSDDYIWGVIAFDSDDDNKARFSTQKGENELANNTKIINILI